MSDKDSIKTIVEGIKELFNIKNVFGEPIETEDKLLIPFMKMGFGFGAGEKEQSETKGFGAGAGLEPISIVVVNKSMKGPEGIRVLDLSKGTETNKAIAELGLVATDLIKEIISNMKENERNSEVHENNSE